MSGPIKKGDLVMIVKPTPCCGEATSVGHVFTVTATDMSSLRGISCGICGASIPPESVLAEKEEDVHKYAILASRCRKIDPPATGEYARVPVRKTQPRKVPA